MAKVPLINCILALEDSIVLAVSIVENLPKDDFAVQEFIKTIDFESSVLEYLRNYQKKLS